MAYRETPMNRKSVSVCLAAAAAILGPLGIALPDGAPGSLRSVVTALAVGLLGASVIVRGTDVIEVPPPLP